jgi:integrase/recombinase XerD
MATVPAPVTPLPPPTSLTTDQFHALAAIPPELEWFANLPNPHTRRAYQQDIRDFQAFAGLRRPEDFRAVTRAHVIAWRDQLTRQGLANDTIRRKLAALSSLYAYLCDRHAVLHNPVLGVKRPRSMNQEGVTPALGDHQARMLLEAPPATMLKGKRDRAILATLLYHGLRCEELCTLKVGDIHQREGVTHLRVEGNGDKVRYLPLHVQAQRLITAYLAAAGHAGDLHGPLFRPVKNNRIGTLAKPLHPASVYHNIVEHYAGELGLTDVMPGLCVHSLRATAATNALQHEADIAKVQEWLGHTDGRQMVAGAPLPQNGGLAHGCIRAAHTGQGIEPRFVSEKDAVPLGLRPLWSAGQVSWRQRAIAPSSRCRARRAGLCRLHWSAWHQRPTGTGGEETPNATSMTAAMRPRAQTWPRTPSAAAPRCHSAGRRASWSADNRHTAPGGDRWERDSGPPSRARFSHGLTAPALTPKAAAIWR